MKIKFSLFAAFLVKWWKRYSKCVSPLLMGAVLVLCSGLDVYAADYYATYEKLVLMKKDGNWAHTTNIMTDGDYITWDMYPTSIEVIDNSNGMSIGSFTISAVDDSLSYSYSSSSSYNETSSTTTNNATGKETTVTSGSERVDASGTMQAPEYTVSAGEITMDREVTYLLNYDRQFNYYIAYSGRTSGTAPSASTYNINYIRTRNKIVPEFRLGVGMDWVNLPTESFEHIGAMCYSDNFVMYETKSNNNYVELGFRLMHKDIVTGTELSLSDTHLQIKINWLAPTRDYFDVRVSASDSLEKDTQTIVENTDRTADQQKEYHDQDQSDATQAGEDMSGFAAQLDNLKNTWSILWYPIEFTNSFVQVFTGGTQSAAYDDYNYISGYRYNNDTGMLEPMMSRSIQPRSAGTGITFPSIELMGYTLWEPYTYDLSTLKDQFPVIFDALYVFISMLEVFWFVGFLRSKYNEVFG